MSSHHFVKEGQEPALLIIDPFSVSQIEPLLEWAPLVVVLDKSLDVVLSWGIKIDAVLVHTNNVELVNEKIIEQYPVEIFPYETDEESLSVGLHILSLHQKAILVVINSTERTFATSQRFTEKINIALLDGVIKWSFIASGQFEKWLPIHTELGLRKTSDTQLFQFLRLNVINENKVAATTDGNVMIKSDSGFWIGESIV